MTLLRRLSYTALVVAFLHIVFGAVVRISGSGMGCGDHWPKCYGYWFPPFSRPDLVIEVLHRYFAAGLTTVVVALLVVAVLRRREPGVGGAGGVLRGSVLAAGLVVFAAGFGAVTVKFANAPWATAVHKLIAVSLLAPLAATTVRAGGLGAARLAGRRQPGRRRTAGERASPALREQPGGERAAGERASNEERASNKTARGATVAAALALVAVLLGALTAKLPGAAVACQGFPLCGDGSLGGGAQHVQLTHRIVAYLLSFHLLGLAVAVSRRGESGVMRAASRAALGVVALQIVLGAAMVLLDLPAELRSLHQANGILLWLVTFTFAYLARYEVRDTRYAVPATAGPRTAYRVPRISDSL
jgi:heme A synthase